MKLASVTDWLTSSYLTSSYPTSNAPNTNDLVSNNPANNNPATGPLNASGSVSGRSVSGGAQVDCHRTISIPSSPIRLIRMKPGMKAALANGATGIDHLIDHPVPTPSLSGAGGRPALRPSSKMLGTVLGSAFGQQSRHQAPPDTQPTISITARSITTGPTTNHSITNREMTM